MVIANSEKAAGSILDIMASLTHFSSISALSGGTGFTVGVDEAGRGPLAGPVVAAAVVAVAVAVVVGGVAVAEAANSPTSDDIVTVKSSAHVDKGLDDAIQSHNSPEINDLGIENANSS